MQQSQGEQPIGKDWNKQKQSRFVLLQPKTAVKGILSIQEKLTNKPRRTDELESLSPWQVACNMIKIITSRRGGCYC